MDATPLNILNMINKIYYFIALFFIANVLNAQYISEVLEYKPAPGQFINKTPWGLPASANSLIGTVTGSLSLGAFGGYVVFKFEEPVKNHPDNPFGVDFTIFGNPLVDWSEHGIVSVMRDDNENGLPDDTWYELAGSDYFFSSTIKGYEVTYTNPNQPKAADVPWYDNQGNSGVVLANSFHNQPYYPSIENFPDINSTEYTLSGTRVSDEVDKSNPTFVKSSKKAFGYADNQYRGKAPYTVPDNPYTPDKENAGGDAFDISWAVDENGEYVDLDEIHFVKVHTAALGNGGWLGEISTEITGASVVEPNSSITGELDLIVIKDLPKEIEGNSFQLEAFAFHKGRWDRSRAIKWTSTLSGASVNNDNLLTFNSSGEITLTASLADRPEITATVSTTLAYDETSSSIAQEELGKIAIYPNPAIDNIHVTGLENATVEIYNIAGTCLYTINEYSSSQPISVAHFANGIYVLKIDGLNFRKTIRFIKR